MSSCPRRFFGPRVSVILVLSAGLSLSAPLAAQSASPDAVLGGLHWRSVGPYIGGRVVAVSGVPGQSNLFYMGGVDAGPARAPA
jgi:hypothetical protein